MELVSIYLQDEQAHDKLISPSSVPCLIPANFQQPFSLSNHHQAVTAQRTHIRSIFQSFSLSVFLKLHLGVLSTISICYAKLFLMTTTRPDHEKLSIGKGGPSMISLSVLTDAPHAPVAPCAPVAPTQHQLHIENLHHICTRQSCSTLR